MPYVRCGNISVLYNMFFMHRGNTYFNLYKTPIFVEHLFATFSVFFFQFKFVSTVNTKSLKSSTFSIFAFPNFNDKLGICFLCM